MSYFDWPAMVTLIAGYALLARHARAAAALIFLSNTFWIPFSIVTGQIPLLIVSLVGGALAGRAWLVRHDDIDLRWSELPEPGDG